MSILLSKLPEYVTIDNAEVKINTDFRFSIRFEQIISDDLLTDEEIYIKALELYYPVIPQNINQAIEKMLWFYRCGKEIEKKKKVSSKEEPYNFDYDADGFYSAFLDQYGVDLQETNLHWWKFKAMFNGLKEDNEIVKIMGYRATDLNKITDKSMKDHYTKLKKIYAVPRKKEEVEHNKNLAALLKRGGDLSELEE